MSRIVLLHGFAGAAASWARVEALLPMPSLSVPLFGHGSRSSPSAQPTFNGELDRLIEWIDPASDLLVGYSMGARLALGLLLAAPERFCGAVLIGAQPGLEDPAQRRQRLSADETLAQRIERDGIEDFVDHWQSLPLFRDQTELEPSILEAQRRIRLAHRAGGLAAALRALGLGAMPNYWPRLGEIRRPLALVVGERDDKFRRIADRMRLAVPQATITTIAGAGHNPVLSHPATVAERLVEEWNRCRK